jgi:formylglycine-generating enzyme required for sulfatase activity
MNDGFGYRLPSEAEWEYACRAGTETEFAFGSSLSWEQANFDGLYPYGNAPKGICRCKTIPVGSFQPNAFGLHDMHGNVWEWCQDYYHETYEDAPRDGSAWFSGGDSKYRVIRGGGYLSDANEARSSSRDRYPPEKGAPAIGFRVVAVARQ